MTWAEDVRRANEALDWIEARQGPLKPDGYARIETTVQQVRAMASEQDDDARLAEIRVAHAPFDFGMKHPITGEWASRISCKHCHEPWPCVQSVLITRLDALTVEIERERYHVGNLNICIKNFTAKCDQLQRQVATATRSVDDWREAWEQKQIELEQSEAERDALRARAERYERALYGPVPTGGMETLSGNECRLCCADAKPDEIDMHEDDCPLRRAVLAAASEGE